MNIINIIYGDALRMTSIFRFRTLENNLNFLNQSKTYKMTGDSKINFYTHIVKSGK
jgi:hypothetical protein